MIDDKKLKHKDKSRVITILTLLIAIGFTPSFGNAAVSIDEDFNGTHLDPYLEDMDSVFTIENGVIHRTSSSGDGDRSYIRTIASD